VKIQLLGEREALFYFFIFYFILFYFDLPVGLKMMNFEGRWFSPVKSRLQGMSKILWNGDFVSSSMYVCRDAINVLFFFPFLLSLLVPFLLCRLFLNHHHHHSPLRTC